MTFLLMVFLAGVCVFEAYPEPPWGGPPWLAAALTAGALIVVTAHAAWIACRVRRGLAAEPASLDRLLVAYDRARARHGALNLGLYLASLILFGWGHLLRPVAGEAGAFGTELALLAPFVLGQVLSWLFFYDADRAAHAASHRLGDGSPFAPGLEAGRAAVPPFGGRWAYVAFHLRQKLALVFIPVALVIARQEIARLLPESFVKSDAFAYAATILGLLSVFLALPLLIRVVLGLRPMPPGPLRDRLVATAKRLKLRLSDILVWDTKQGMANAMIVGLVPWMRYVVFTDRLLEEFTAEEVQAVFGHELGHVKHQHMLFYLAFLMVSIVVLSLLAAHYVLPGLRDIGNELAAYFPTLIAENAGEWLGPDGVGSLIPVLGLVLIYILVVFGFLSRHCERQADVYGCRVVSCGDPGCTGHDSDTIYASAGTPCPTAIRTFARALDRVALVNGIDRDRPGYFQSWQHSTIARRVAFLLGLLKDARAERTFQERLAGVKWTLMAGLTAGLAWLIAFRGWK